MLDNPKIDKQKFLNVFLNQMQMSGDLPQGLNKQIDRLQKGLKDGGDQSFGNDQPEYGAG